MQEVLTTTWLNQGLSAVLSLLVIFALFVGGRAAYKHLPDYLAKQMKAREEQIKLSEKQLHATEEQTEMMSQFISVIQDNNHFMEVRSADSEKNRAKIKELELVIKNLELSLCNNQENDLETRKSLTSTVRMLREIYKVSVGYEYVDIEEMET